MEAFAWLGQMIEALGKFIPRVFIIRATHRGVRWLLGRRIKALKPGIHVYWPLITEVETIAAARQTINLPTQVLMTVDRRQIVVGALIVFCIKDVVKAIGERNWDIDTTIGDISQAAIVEVISRSNLNDLVDGIAGDVEKKLTSTTRKRLREFGGVCAAGCRD